jgi:hypothetical protein
MAKDARGAILGYRDALDIHDEIVALANSHPKTISDADISLLRVAVDYLEHQVAAYWKHRISWEPLLSDLAAMTPQPEPASAP